MTIPDFLTALPDLKDRFLWAEDDFGHLRASHPACPSEVFATITALAYVQMGIIFDVFLDWDQAALALGLAFPDACEIVGAEDHSRGHDAQLARALRRAVGLSHREDITCP